MTDDDAIWSVLAIAPTRDVAAIRAGYAQRLRAIDPATDPDGFARLRQAYQTALAAAEVPPSDNRAASSDPEPGAAGDRDAAGDDRVADTMRRFDERRRAGDASGAMQVLERALADDPARFTTLELAAFDGFAIRRGLSVGLFRALVDRFDWRDAAGTPARSRPEQHAVLLARLEAEDWFDALRDTAARPGPAALPASIMLATPDALDRLRPPGGRFEGEAVAAARTLFGAFGQRAQFLELRVEPACLAAAREAIEGPPLVVALPPPLRPFPPEELARRQALERRASAVGLLPFLVALSIPSVRRLPTMQKRIVHARRVARFAVVILAAVFVGMAIGGDHGWP